MNKALDEIKDLLEAHEFAATNTPTHWKKTPARQKLDDDLINAIDSIITKASTARAIEELEELYHTPGNTKNVWNALYDRLDELKKGLKDG